MTDDPNPGWLRVGLPSSYNQVSVNVRFARADAIPPHRDKWIDLHRWWSVEAAIRVLRARVFQGGA